MRLYDWWYDRQAQVIVFITELLTDGSLRRFIRRKHTAGITMSALKRYAWQVLQGLLYLHGHFPPIIHRWVVCGAGAVGCGVAAGRRLRNQESEWHCV
jgi:WNK lysine deficient protein kinase